MLYLMKSCGLGSIRRGLASADLEAWHAIEAFLCLVTPWQYPPRLDMLFYILSRLGSILRLTFGGFRRQTVRYRLPKDCHSESRPGILLLVTVL